MELYLRACSKAVGAAATETAASHLVADSERWGEVPHKMQFPGVEAARLLDLPLGVKLPLIPGSNTLFYTTNLSEKLFQPSYGFNLNDPYGRLLETSYKSLHDHHLSAYYKRKDILKQLNKGGYITSNNKVVCTLKEFNKYRQYLTSLKLDFERNYVREQKMLEKQVTKLQEHNQIPDSRDTAQLIEWLLEEGTQSIQDQECLIRHRYLDMINREVEKLERSAEELHLIRKNEEEKRQREHTRRKLSLLRKIEEEWKTKEMLLLTSIREEVKREARVKEQRRKNREESDRKKQALLEEKIAYHLRKMKENSLRREETDKTSLEYKGAISPKKKKNEDPKVPEQKTSREFKKHAKLSVQPSHSSTKSRTKKSVTSTYSPGDVNDDDVTDARRDGDLPKKASGIETGGQPSHGGFLSQVPSNTQQQILQNGLREKEWKTKEMLLLTSIGEEVKREARVKEQRRKNREESDRKKQALLEEKMAYHSRKMKGNSLRREETDKTSLEYKGAISPKKKKNEDPKVPEQKTSREFKTLSYSGDLPKKASGIETGVQNSPIKNIIQPSPSLRGAPPKEDIYNYNITFAPELNRPSKRELPTTLYERSTNKKPSCPFEIGQPSHGGFFPQVPSNTQQQILQNGLREKEWKTKEMLLLTSIGEEVKREARVKEQRRKNREESDRKKQALLEEKMAYHSRKMKGNSLRREETDKTSLEYKGAISPKKKKNEDPKVPEQKTSREFKKHATLSVQPSRSSTKSGTKKSVTSTYSPGDVNDDDVTDAKRDGDLPKKASGIETGVQNSPIKNIIQPSPSLRGAPPKEDIYNYNITFAPELNRPSKRELPTTLYERSTNKKPSCPFEIGQPSHGGFFPQVPSNTQQQILQNGLREKEWKTKEMLLLTSIGEEVKREARVKEQRRKNREESDRKKQALLEEKMAYHSRKMKGNSLRREETDKTSLEYKGAISPKKKKNEDPKVPEQKTSREFKKHATLSVQPSRSSTKSGTKKSVTSTYSPGDVNDDDVTDAKRDGDLPKKASGIETGVQNSPIKNIIQPSPSLRGAPPKEDIYNYNITFAPELNRPSKRELPTTLYERSTNKKPSCPFEIGQPSHGAFLPQVPSNTQQQILQNGLREKISAEELNTILQNVMTWVVATVTSILYPAITMYEERWRTNIYPLSDDLVLSSGSSSFCSTCSDEYAYRAYSAATAKKISCTDVSSKTVNLPTVPDGQPMITKISRPTQIETTILKGTYSNKKGQTVAQFKYNKMGMSYDVPKVRSCKSDSQLLSPVEVGEKKDATTETEEIPPDSPEEKEKPITEMKELKNIFVNFKCHLKEETELILENIFQEILSDLGQAIPSLSAVTAEVFVDHLETGKASLLSNVDVCSAAADIFENMLDKLQSAVEKKCIEIFSQEDLSVTFKPDLFPSEEHFISKPEKSLKTAVCGSLEPMCDIAEDMVHVILEKLMMFAASKKSNLSEQKETEATEQVTVEKQDVEKSPKKYSEVSTQVSTSTVAMPMPMPVPVPMPTMPTMPMPVPMSVHCTESDVASVVVKEEIQNLMSNIFSQSSVVGYVEEAISTILGYIQTELDNERLIASEEAIIVLQLLDGIFIEPNEEEEKEEEVQIDISQSKRPSLKSPTLFKEEYRLTGTTVSKSGPRSGKPLPPVNVPGMVFYSDDDNEEIDRMVESGLVSSVRDQKPLLQEQAMKEQFEREVTGLGHKRKVKSPTKPASRGKVAFHEWRVQSELQTSSSEDKLAEEVKPKKQMLDFSQDEKYQIQKASENIVTDILTDMLREMITMPPSQLSYTDVKETSSFASGMPHGLSPEEWMDQVRNEMFSTSEINVVANDMTDAVLKILQTASSCQISDVNKDSSTTSLYQSSVDAPDTPPKIKEIYEIHQIAPLVSKEPLKIWFESDKKMKSLFDIEQAQPPWLESPATEETPEGDDISDKIIHTIFKKLKSFVFPKLQKCFRPEQYETTSIFRRPSTRDQTPAPSHSKLFSPSKLRSQLGAYTTKVVNIVLGAICSELEVNKKKKNGMEPEPPITFVEGDNFPLSDKELESVVSNLNDDVTASSLVTCICEMLSGRSTDKKNPVFPSDMPMPDTFDETDYIDIERQSTSWQHKKPTACHSSSIQVKVPFQSQKCPIIPCALHSVFSGENVNEAARSQVLERIGNTLFEMLNKMMGEPLLPSLSHLSVHEECTDESLRATPALHSNIQVVSNGILEDILEKLCSEMDHIPLNFEVMKISNDLDEDSLYPTVVVEEVAKCTDGMFFMVSDTIQEGSKEVFSHKMKNADPSRRASIHRNNLKMVASDILKTVFNKLEGFANLNLWSRGTTRSENCGWMSPQASTSTKVETHDDHLQSTLQINAKKVSSAILKAIQVELNGNPSDSEAKVSNPTQEKVIKNLANLILDAVSPEIFQESESEERGIEYYRYKPVYGNFLPGGAESDAFLEDFEQAEEEGEPPGDEDKEDTVKQPALEKTFKKIEVELKEPQKSPVMPIIRNVLNEIFQNALVNQLNVLSLSHSCGISHSAEQPVTKTFIRFMDKTMGTLVSEADVTIVTDDIVKTVFQKLYSAARADRNTNKSRYKTITFSASAPFHEQSNQRKTSVYPTALNRESHQLHSSFNVERLSKVNVVEDIVQTVISNLESFATSKVKSLFYPPVSFTTSRALPTPQELTSLSKELLPTKEVHSPNEEISYPSTDLSRPENMTSACHLSISKLNKYATEVARKILQRIKQELDKELESPVVTRNIVLSENIASQVVNTVLDIVSTKGKSDKNKPEKDNGSDLQESIVEKLFNKTEYRKELQFQIHGIIENILSDICEKKLHQNHVPLSPATLHQDNVGAKHPAASPEVAIECTNDGSPKLSIPKSYVIMIANDMVNIVLQNLSSAVIVGRNIKEPISAHLSLKSRCDTISKTESEPPIFRDITEEKIRSGPSNVGKKKTKVIRVKSPHDDDKQMPVAKADDASQSLFDPCEENADYITKNILNRLESFATKRVDSLISIDSQTKEKSFVVTELSSHLQHEDHFLVPGQVQSNMKALKLTTTKALLGQNLRDTSLASYKEETASTSHLSQTNLREYADIIASAVLTIIKNDLDIEMHRMCSHPNNASFRENIIASEIVNNLLKTFGDKRSLKEGSSLSKLQIAVQNEVLLEDRQNKNTEISLLSKYSLKQSSLNSENESQRTVLEEIFMRNGGSRQEETAPIVSTVEDVLNKVNQRITEDISHLPPFNELSHLMSESKMKTPNGVPKKSFQSNISIVANDIVDSVFGKMYSLVVTSMYENGETEREVTVTGNKDILVAKTPCFSVSKLSEKRSEPSQATMPQTYPHSSVKNMLLEDTLLHCSPLRVGEDLVQMVLNKIISFASLNLEEYSFPDVPSDGVPSSQQHVAKTSPKPGLSSSLKTALKLSSVQKCKAKSQAISGNSKGKRKAKIPIEEKIALRGSRSKSLLSPSHVLSTGDAKTSPLQAKLPIWELKNYAKDIVSIILETIVDEFQRVKCSKMMIDIGSLPNSDQITAASELVNTVLQGLYSSNSNNFTYQIKSAHLEDVKFPERKLGTESFSKPQACFFLENVSSQLEQIFPKEGIFKKMFDKWQTESNDMENEKYKLLTVAENVLSEILIKVKELECSVSLLKMPPIEACESIFCNNFKRTPASVDDSKTQINLFGRELVEILFEKLQLCFLTEMPIPDNKETLARKKEQTNSRTKYFSGQLFSNVPSYSTKLKDQISLSSNSRIAREIVENVLHTLEAFVDLQFKHISKYEFPEIMKISIENFYPAQQRPLNRRILPKLQPLNDFPDESKLSSIITKENIQKTLFQVHSFHSQLRTYAINTVSDMLSIIKCKLDKEISQVEPSPINILEENMVASEIISNLMDQCVHFSDSMLENMPKESPVRGAENTYTVHRVEVATTMKMSNSKLKEVTIRESLPPFQVPGTAIFSEKELGKYNRNSSNLSSYARYSAGDTSETSGTVGRTESEPGPSSSGRERQNKSSRRSNFNYFEQDPTQQESSLPEGSVLEKLFKKNNEPVDVVLKEIMPFVDLEEDKEEPRTFHCEQLKPDIEPKHISTTVTPLKICLAAENIVNTVLSCYGLGTQAHATGSNVETIKPFFISKSQSSSTVSSQSIDQKDERSNLFRTWEKRLQYASEKEFKNHENPMSHRNEDYTLLEKRENKTFPRADKMETLKTFEVITFADYELGPSEINQIARHVTMSVVTHFKNLQSGGSCDEKVPIVSSLSRKKLDPKRPLRSGQTESSLNEFCEHLTVSVIFHIISSVLDGTEDSRAKLKYLGNKISASEKFISINSEMLGAQGSKSRSILIDDIAFSIFEIIIRILSNSNILKADVTEHAVSLQTKYIYSPDIAAMDIDDLFEDLLLGVIHVLTKEMGINNRCNNKGKSLPMSKNQSVPICQKTRPIEREVSQQSWDPSLTHKTDQLVQKNKISSVASKLDSLLGSLKSLESNEMVNKIFNIVLDLFLPDECQSGILDSVKASTRHFFASSEKQPNNLGLSPKSIFLLNVVCEKLIRTLLEKYTTTDILASSPLSKELSTAEQQLFNVIRSVEEEEFGYGEEKVSPEQAEPFQAEDYVSDFVLEQLAESEKKLLSSESMLSVISHGLVKSLMEKLSNSVQAAPPKPQYANKLSKYSARERLSNAQGAQLAKGLMQSRDKLTSETLNHLQIINSKIRPPFKQFSASSMKKLGRKELKINTVPKMLHSGQLNTGVYSATFLEDIISDLFSSIYTALYDRDENVTEEQLSEMNTLIVNSVVNAFNNTQVTVLRNAEERLCFPPVQKEAVTKIVDSVYNEVLQEYQSKMTYVNENDAADDLKLLAERMTNAVLAEILDYQLPSCFVERLTPESYYPLKVENVLQKLQENLRESGSQVQPSAGYTTMLPHSFLEDVIRKLLSHIIPPSSSDVWSMEKKYLMSSDFNEMSACIINKVMSAISKHKIWLTKYDHQYLYSERNLQTMVDSVYNNILQISGSHSSIQKSITSQSPIIVDRIASFIIQEITESHLQPFLSGDSVSQSTTATDEMSTMVKNALLFRIFPSASEMVPYQEDLKDTSGVNFNEVASKLISDIREKISKHEIRFSKDAEEPQYIYSEDDVQNLVDYVFKNILKNSGSREAIEQEITSSNNAFIDRVAGFIIRNICQQHLQPFVSGKTFPPLQIYHVGGRRQLLQFYAGVYSSTFLEEVVSGILSKIFYKVMGIAHAKIGREPESELEETAIRLINSVSEEFEKAEVSILENAEEELGLPQVDRNIIIKIIDTAYNKVLQEYDLDRALDKDFFNDTKTLAERITKIILAEIFDFQLQPDLVARLPFRSLSNLNVDVLLKKVQSEINQPKPQRQTSTIYTTMLSHTHLEKIVTQLLSQMSSDSRAEDSVTSKPDLSKTVVKLINEIMTIISKHAIWITKHGNEKQSMISETDIENMVESIYADISCSNLYQSLTKDKKDINNIPVSKIASFIIKEIFNHHLQSFLSQEQTLSQSTADLTRKQTDKDVEIDPKELAFIVNSAIFLEEVISELLCKILYAFSHNFISSEDPKSKTKVTDIITKLVQSIVLEFAASQILVAENFDENLCFSEGYKEMVSKIVNLIYEKITDDYKSLDLIYADIEHDINNFGRKIYNLLLGEIYDYQVQGLISGTLSLSTYSSLRAENIIRNVLNVIGKESHYLPSFITVLPRCLLEDMVSKLLGHIFPSSETRVQIKEQEAPPDDDFMSAASRLTDAIIAEISQHEIRLTTAEENASHMNLETIESIVDSICKNILEKAEFQAEVQKEESEKGGTFLTKIAVFIMKEIVDHHLQPFLHEDDSDSGEASDKESVVDVLEQEKERLSTPQPSLYSATFLEDVIFDLVRKLYPIPKTPEYDEDESTKETNLVGMAIKLVNSLIDEFRKSDIKVLPNAEELFSFPPVDKETIDKVSDSVYDEVVKKYRSEDVHHDEEESNIYIEMITNLAKKAISAFKVKPLFSGDWFSPFFSFLEPDNITQRVQFLPPKIPLDKDIRDAPIKDFSLKDSLVVVNLARNIKDGTDLGTISEKKGEEKFKTIPRNDDQESVFISLANTMKTKMCALESADWDLTDKKESEKKTSESPIRKDKDKDSMQLISVATSTRSSIKSHQDRGWKTSDKRNDESSAKEDKVDEYKEESVKVFALMKSKIPEPDFKRTPKSSVKKKEHHLAAENNDKPIQYISPVKSKKTSEPVLKLSSSKKFEEKKKDISVGTDDDEGAFRFTPAVTALKSMRTLHDPNFKSAFKSKRERCVQTDTEDDSKVSFENVIENIYSNVLEMSTQTSLDDTRYANVIPAQTAHAENLGQPSPVTSLHLVHKHVPDKGKEVKKHLPDNAKTSSYSPEMRLSIFSARFLEDVVIEIVNKLIFSSSPETCEECKKIQDDVNQTELYETAMKLIDSLLKEFSEAQIRVFRPTEEKQPLPQEPKVLIEEKVPDKHSSVTREGLTLQRTPSPPKIPPVPPKILVDRESRTDTQRYIDYMPPVNKTLVSKVVHSSLCNVLHEYRSQDSIYKDINDNDKLAKRLAGAVIGEMFQHQLNLLLQDELPSEVCVPLESKDVVTKVQKVAKKHTKECQTSSPYTIVLPREFLEEMISSLLAKIFPSGTKKSLDSEVEGDSLFTELNFLQMKLVSRVMTEISKDEDMIIQYVECLHPNDYEVIQVVVQSVYSNLLPQFGSQEVIQNCATSGCRMLSESIADLVIREVAGNQLQTYFSGELTPHQCAKVDSVVENILKDTSQSPVGLPTKRTYDHKLPLNILEEIAVQFLSRLLSVFPMIERERTKSLEAELEKITNKIITSLKEFISESPIKVVQQANEPPTLAKEYNQAIEKVVDNVYGSVLKHSGSHISMYKDLVGKSNVLADIIAFLMVKEISNPEFQPYMERILHEEKRSRGQKIPLEEKFSWEERIPSKEKFSWKERIPCEEKFSWEERIAREERIPCEEKFSQKERIPREEKFSHEERIASEKRISHEEKLPCEEETSGPQLALEAVKIMEKVLKILDDIKSQEKPSAPKIPVLDASFLEDTLALFLAKIVKLPCVATKEAKSLSKPELNKIASQLTKSVAAEISKSSINLVAADSEVYFMNPENIEMISQVVDSVYSNVLRQSGTQEEFFHDIKSMNRFFPKKVASLIISEISHCPSESVSSRSSATDVVSDLDVDRIVKKASDHATKMGSVLLREDDFGGDDLPIKIVPHLGNKPIRIDPAIVSQHLAVISLKTQPLEKLKKQCLSRTGHSLAELRRASISGRTYSSEIVDIESRKKERRISLDKTGRLDVKPFEVVCRNSFQNLRKPDITRVELLKDVQSKKDLIIRLVAHDIDEDRDNRGDGGLISDEEESDFREVVLKEECALGLMDMSMKDEEEEKVPESKVSLPKSSLSSSSLKKLLSISKCCQATSTTTPEKIETSPSQIKEAEVQKVPDEPEKPNELEVLEIPEVPITIAASEVLTQEASLSKERLLT